MLDDVADSSSETQRVANILMRGVFQSSGQNCIGIERVICMPRVYDLLVTRLTPLIRNLRVGSALDDDDVDVGACISAAAFDRLEELIEDAVAHGAKLLVGGKRYQHPKHSKGHYFAPTLLVDVTADMRIARTELFAPIFLMMRAESISDVIDMTNGTEYGLGCSVFGSDAQAVNRIVDEVKVGMVSVNDFAVYYAVQLPFGGVRGSGYGRFAGEEGLRGLCNTKAVCRDRFPGLVRTSIPAPLCYPIRNAKKAWDVCRGVVELGYGENLGRRVRGLKKVVGL